MPWFLLKLAPLLKYGSMIMRWVPIMNLMVLKNRWKEILILVLISIIGFGGWYHTSKKSSLEEDILVYEVRLAAEKNNNEALKITIDGFLEDLKTLQESNNDFEKKVAESQARIRELQENPRVVYRNIYRDRLPEQCQKKIDWLKGKLLEIKENE